MTQAPDDVPRAPEPDPGVPESRQAALRRLVDQGVLSPEQADAVRQALHLDAAPRPVPRVPWAEIAGYLGGGLVLTGIFVLVATSWDQLTEPARTAMVGGFTVLLIVAGVVTAGGPAGLATTRTGPVTARLRVGGVLLALAAVGTAITVGVGFPDDAGAAMMATAAGSGLLVAAAGYAVLPTVFGLLTATVLGTRAVVSTVEVATRLTPLNLALALLGCGLLLAVLALGGLLRHRLVGLGFGVTLAVVGAQQPLGEPGRAFLAYLLTFAVGAVSLVLYHWVRTWVLLVAGIVAITLVIPEMIWDVTNGAVGGAAILLVAGAVLLVASGLGFRLHRATGHGGQEPAH